MELNLGKQPFKKFTKSALIDMLEDAMLIEQERSKPLHKRGDPKKREKDEATEEADAEREKLADLDEEMHGSPAPIEMDDEDLSDEAMDMVEEEVDKTKAKKKKKA